MSMNRLSSEHEWLNHVQMSAVDENERVLISSASGPILRIPRALGEVVVAAKELWPTVDAELIAENIRLKPSDHVSQGAQSLSAEQIRVVLETLGKAPAMKRLEADSGRRVQFRKPFSIQLTLFNPTWLLARLPWVARVIRSRAFWWIVAALNTVGIGAVSMQFLDQGSAIHDATTVSGYLWLLFALYLTIFVHELSHAATLVAYGGVSRRVGFMLFYLVPAFFCDVSEAWNLRPAERAKVALAGIAAQGNLGAIAGVSAFFLPRELATLAATFSLLCILYGVLNLIPFVKLDGYIALVGYLDTPNLRANCMKEFQDWATGLLFHTRTYAAAELAAPHKPLRLIFGFLCSVFPLVILTGVVVSAGSYLASLGKVAVWIQLIMAATLVIVISLRGLGHMIRLQKSGVRLRRLVVFSSVWLILLALLTTAVPFPNNVRGGLFTDADGPKMVVLGGSTGFTGGAVDLYAPGLVTGVSLGRATAVGAMEPCTVPLAATVAVKESDLSLQAQCVALDYAGTAPRTGTTVWEVPGQTIAQWAGNLVARLTS